MLKAGKEAEEMEKLSSKIKQLEEAVAKGDENRKQLETQVRSSSCVFQLSHNGVALQGYCVSS